MLIRLNLLRYLPGLFFVFAVSASFAATSTQTANSSPALPAKMTGHTIKSAVATAAVSRSTAVNATTSVDEISLNAAAHDTLPAETPDPYEKFNRAMFGLNDKVDTYALKPVASLYNTIMPKPLNEGVHNFFSNLGELPTIANDILQFNFYQMANDIWRLGINTTIGIGGFFDVASRMGLKYYSNDFGLTLAKWGWKNSNYLVLPLLGPNTIRDGIEVPVDYYAFSVYPYIQPDGTRYVIYSVGVLDRRAQLLQFQSVFEEAAIDKYIFTRNAYLQRRAYQIEQTRHRGYMEQEAQAGNSQ